MEMTVSNQPQTWQPLAIEQGTRTLQASRSGMALISNNQEMKVSIVTKEGDKVTLSLASKSAAFSAIDEQMGDDGQGNISYEKNQVTLGLYEREMSFTVEGDLSKEELRDIRKVMKGLDKMMSKFVGGQMSAMAAQAGKLKGLDSIAGLEADMSYERTVLVAQQSNVTTTYNQNGLPDTTERTPQVLAPTEDQNQTPEKLADQIAGRIRSSRTPASRMMRFVNQLMKDYRQQTKENNALSSMIEKVQDHLVQAFQGTNALKGTDALQAETSLFETNHAA